MTRPILHYLKKSQDPNNSRFTRIMYGLQDSGIQSAIGALLSVGVSYLTRNPKAGQAVSLAYFAPISAESQRQDNAEGKLQVAVIFLIDTYWRYYYFLALLKVL